MKNDSVKRTDFKIKIVLGNFYQGCVVEAGVGKVGSFWERGVGVVKFWEAGFKVEVEVSKTS